MAIIHVTERAALKINEIEKYSRNKWGAPRADKYIDDVNETLALLRNHPNLLQTKSEISQYLKFYLSGEHILVFEQINDHIYLVTAMHSRMDISRRIQELEPTLKSEVEFIHTKMLQNL
ncbi:MAG: type II toxin-antitoxin system RelE/ParE family toxin [Pseudohongiellaceae bacterium]